MSVPDHRTSDQAAELTLDILTSVVGMQQGSKVGFRLWDGRCWPDEHERPATIVLNHPGALRAMFMPGTEIGMAEAYLYGDFDVEGDIEEVFALAEQLQLDLSDLLSKLKIGRDLMRLPRSRRARETRRGPARMHGRRHSIDRDRQAIAYHYDVSNEFYALWLDQRMVYSSAYFHTAEESLDLAQEHKLEHICRKLRLRSGQRLLDIGCGWGGLVIYAAQRYGVHALGITLSQPQADLANERIAAAGLANQASVEVRDYRDLESSQPFDAIASVGMFEHVGETMLGTYFKHAWDLLKPAGCFLNHGIARRATDDPTDRSTFSNAYVFPDGELEPISTSLRVAERSGFEVRDVESLREHYALTLRRWVHRLENHHADALQHVDEPTYRVWRLFMSGSAYGFSHGNLNVYQSLLVKPDEAGRSGLPLTRADLYSRDAFESAPIETANAQAALG